MLLQAQELVNIKECCPAIFAAVLADEVIVCVDLLAFAIPLDELSCARALELAVPVILVDVDAVKP